MVSVDFDKPRQLKYDLDAVRDLEAGMNGQPLGSIVQQLGQIGVNAIVFSLWAGLKWEDRGLSPNLVTKRLQTYIKAGKSLKKLAEAINDALEETGLFRTDEDPEGNAQPEPTATT